MRVVEKSALNELILEGIENLKEKRKEDAGKWIYVYAPEVYDQMIIELETLRKELAGKEVEI